MLAVHQSPCHLRAAHNKGLRRQCNVACRVLFAPNVHDASPRVLAEALSLDVPILVNRHIVGGWKYVNSETGAFFDSADNVVPAFTDIMGCLQAGQLHPRDWFKCAP